MIRQRYSFIEKCITLIKCDLSIQRLKKKFKNKTKTIFDGTSLIILVYCIYMNLNKFFGVLLSKFKSKRLRRKIYLFKNISNA